jgi:hypothetical protein
MIEIEQPFRRDRPAVQLEVNHVADRFDFPNRVSLWTLSCDERWERGGKEREKAAHGRRVGFKENCESRILLNSRSDTVTAFQDCHPEAKPKDLMLVQ